MSNNTFTVKYPYRRPLLLHLVVIDHGDIKSIKALNEENMSIDSIASTRPNSEHFISVIKHSYESITTPLEDMLIEAGLMNVTGMAIKEWEDVIDVEFDSEWLNSLPVLHAPEKCTEDNLIKVGYEYSCARYRPTACVKHGDYVWAINRFSDGSWQIHGEHTSDRDKGFHTGYELPLVETWLEAMRLEKAMDEFVDAGKQIAEKYGVSFVNDLIAPVAGGYWYLEG